MLQACMQEGRSTSVESSERICEDSGTCRGASGLISCGSNMSSCPGYRRGEKRCWRAWASHISSTTMTPSSTGTTCTGIPSCGPLWIEYELLPWLPAWGETLLASLGIAYLVDYDDAVFHRYDLHRNPFVRAALDRI